MVKSEKIQFLDRNDVLDRLNDADWKTIRFRLLEHAASRIKRLSWRSGKQSLPKGGSAEDLVTQAIQKTYEGASAAARSGGGGTGYRRWDPEQRPDLLEYLKAVVDSDVNHLVNSEEHRLTSYGVEAPPETTVLTNASQQAHHQNPEEHALQDESEREKAVGLEDFVAELNDDFKNDRSVRLLLQSFQRQAERNETIKPATVARETGLDISEVRNAIKRLRRKKHAQGS